MTTFDINNVPTVTNTRLAQALSHIEELSAGIKSAVAAGRCDIYESTTEGDIALARAIHALAEQSLAFEDMRGGVCR